MASGADDRRRADRAPRPAPAAARRSGGCATLSRPALDDPRPDRVDRGLDAVLDLELHQDAGDVVLHRLRADEELRGDLGVAFALGQQPKHLDLALGQAGVRPSRLLAVARVLTQA